MEIIGKIKKIMDTQVVSDKFKKREFVLGIDLNTPYPQDVLFQTTNDRVYMLDNLKPNDEVKVFFNIRGKEYKNANNETKYFVSLEAFRIDKFVSLNKSTAVINEAEIINNLQKEPQSNQNTSQQKTSPYYESLSQNNEENDIQINEEGDELPF